MSRTILFVLFFLAVFLQAGAYGLTFMLPRLFEGFSANEKVVGTMLMITTIATLISVYYSGHLADKFGRVFTLGAACATIAIALFLYGVADSVGITLVLASVLLGLGWALTYSLVPVVLTRLVGTDERIRYFAINSVSLMAGFGLSPVFAAWMESTGYTVNEAFYVTAALCAVSALLFFILIKPVQTHSLQAAADTRTKLSLDSVKAILTSQARLPVIMVCLGASVFAAMNNFQTVFAESRGLNYADYFLIYTLTVVVFRVFLARFKGGQSPYKTIAVLQYIMAASVVLFLFSGGNDFLYGCVAFLFGIGYGVSYPILAAMAANDADEDLLPQTLQLFALTYFIGIFGFPLVAGWLLVESTVTVLLIITAALATLEASMALVRAKQRKRAALQPQAEV